MINVIIKESDVIAAAHEGMDAFMQVFVDGIYAAIGGQLTAETMAELNSDQITLLAYSIMREEVMDGGMVQLIHNGYGGFIFLNPFDKALMEWGLTDLARVVKKGRRAYFKHRKEIEVECTDDEFMAMFERMPEFDDLDDDFVANEEQWTAMVACYIDENINVFAEVKSE